MRACFLSALLVLGSTSAASAQQPTSSADAPGLRFDVGGGATAGYAGGGNLGPGLGPAVSAAAAGPSLELGLGVQLTRHAAIYARGELSSILLLNQGAAYAIAEWTPNRWFSLGSGLGYDGMVTAWIGGCATAAPCTRNSWAGVSVPIIVSLNVMSREAWARPRNRPALRVELEAAGGVEPTTGIFGFHAAANVGFVLM